MALKKMTVVLLCTIAGSATAQTYTTSTTTADSTELYTTSTLLDEVEITGLTGGTNIRQASAPISVVGNDELKAHATTNIIDALTRKPGVAQITTGTGIAKPIIRGLGFNRVVVINQGVRQEGQQWGDEHGIEIDGNMVNRAEIQMGAASLTYGSDAMAGVIIMHEAPLPARNTIGGEAGAEYQTNSGLWAYTLAQNGRSSNDWIWDLRWSQRQAHDYHAPNDGYVVNTRFHEKALNGKLGTVKDWGQSFLKFSYFQQEPGMTDYEEGYTTGNKSYSITSPYQDVRHYKAVADNNFNLRRGNLKTTLGYQQNRRREYEEEEECELDLHLHTLTYDVRYSFPEADSWKLNTGINGMYQKSKNEGEEYLIPDFHLFDIGAFATASYSHTKRLHSSGGIRFDNRRLHSHRLEEDGEERFADFSRSYTAISGSIGSVYNATDKLDVKANLTTGFRGPSINELASNGVHEGTFRYEVGDNSLDAEKNWQADLAAVFEGKHIGFSLSVFANRINNYIYTKRTEEEKEGQPVYKYTQDDARLFGGESNLTMHLTKGLDFENAYSLYSGQLAHPTSGFKYLPNIPANRWLSCLRYTAPLRSKALRNLFVEIEFDKNWAAKHIMEGNGTETTTPGYQLWNAAAGIDICRKKTKILTMRLAAQNIFDEGYQNHLSRLKYADTYAYTGRHGLQNQGRNIAVKIHIPLVFKSGEVHEKED